ncbi:arrestin domain-containing protein 17-like isoform 1-T2 [Glossina fuscipes fuscipes]
MGLKGCEIVLDNPWNTYYAGQTINGKVNLTFDSTKKVRGITIRFLGEANTQWSNRRRVTNSAVRGEHETVFYRGHEKYFQIQYYLLGGKNSAEIELPAGTHTYPFTYALPPILPSSFEGQFGHVRYTIKVTLDRPWKFDQDMKMAFTVIAPVDLNSNACVKEPFKLELEKTFCCFCCRSGPLSVLITVPVTGYVSGQVIPIICECDNGSNVSITTVKFALRKRVTFLTQRPHAEAKVSEITIAKIAVGPIRANESRTFSQQLEIPPLPPTNLMHCGIITLSYDLQVKCNVSGPHSNLSGNIPITLGTIPLASFKPPPPCLDMPSKVSTQDRDNLSMGLTQVVNVSSSSYGTGGALGWHAADCDGVQTHSNIPPPKFLESQFKAQKIIGHDDSELTKVINDAFAPRYPTFQFAPSAPPMLN